MERHTRHTCNSGCVEIDTGSFVVCSTTGTVLRDKRLVIQRDVCCGNRGTSELPLGAPPDPGATRRGRKRRATEISSEHLSDAISAVIKRLLFSDERYALQAKLAVAARKGAFAALHADVLAGDTSSVPVLWSKFKARMEESAGLFWNRGGVPLQLPEGVMRDRVADYTGTVSVIYQHISDVAKLHAGSGGSGGSGRKAGLQKKGKEKGGGALVLLPEIATACILRRMADGIRRSDLSWVIEPDPLLAFWMPPQRHMAKFVGAAYNSTQHFVGYFIDQCQYTLPSF